MAVYTKVKVEWNLIDRIERWNRVNVSTTCNSVENLIDRIERQEVHHAEVGACGTVNLIDRIESIL